jgi:hypothetical protein
MYSKKEKQHIAQEIETLLLSFNHPEMPTEKPQFKIHIDGKESWSWADIEPNWTYENREPEVNEWNEVARDILGKEDTNT